VKHQRETLMNKIPGLSRTRRNPVNKTINCYRTKHKLKQKSIGSTGPPVLDNCDQW